MIGVDTTSLITIIWLLIMVGLVYWFNSVLKRIERTLLDIKKLLENKA